MDFDLHINEAIQVIDLIKLIKWSSLPIFFSIIIPVFYSTFYKLNPKDESSLNSSSSSLDKVISFFSLPSLDRFIINTSVLLFVLGTITILIDQNYKERTRNNALRVKQYLMNGNIYAISKDSLVIGTKKLSNLELKDIENIVYQYPSEFIEVEDRTIVLRDSILFQKILTTSTKLLDNYLSNPNLSPIQNIDTIFKNSTFFTRQVVRKLLIDSSNKYIYCLSTCGGNSIIIRRGK